ADTPMSDSEHEPIRWGRLAALAALLLGGALLDRAMGWHDSLTPESMRAMIVESGPAGIAAYVLLFVAANVVSIPGVLFVVAASLAYGPELGWLLAWSAAYLAVLVNFALARKVGGQPAKALKGAWAQKLLGMLERRPILAIVLLRAVFMAGPPVNYALALSPVRARDYVLGSAIGLVFPVGVVCYASAGALSWLS
ncbi:MAG: VTT domain-containing protein, partial [Myxococcota bacterium]